MTTTATCIHEWEIEAATSHWSRGVCRLCFETKMFENSTDQPLMTKTKASGTTLGESQSRYGKTEYPE